MERPPFIVSGDPQRWKEQFGTTADAGNKIQLAMAAVYPCVIWRQGFKSNTQNNASSASAIVIKEIRTFSFYYFSRGPIIGLFVNEPTQK
jgi:hypothetical protein